jgi:superfamily II DNA/RNA helicase
MFPSFAELGVPAPLCATLGRRGIEKPFPIQAATLPDVLAGRDVAGKAPTGSGKTLAFGLGIAARAAAADGPPRPRRPRALVLVPTRELAAQVQRELAALLDERRDGPVAAIYGGVGYGPQRKLLARGVAAVVACPGRLEDLIATGDVVLDKVDLVVLDEADRMADMGFMPAVRRLLDRTPERRQTLLFSATLDGDVDALVRRYQHDPVRHEAVALAEEQDDVDHRFWTVTRDERVALTAEVIARTGPTIVFTRTRHGADRVAKQLGRAGVKAVPIHGRRSQAQRDQALHQFRTGRAPALVATDVAARGIHVDGVACVVHFDLPEEPKDYVHRSGRTGRAGATGTVVSLVVEDGHRATRALQREVGRTEPITAPDLDALGAGAPVPARTTAPLEVEVDAAPVLSPARAAAAPAERPHRERRRGRERSERAERPERAQRTERAARTERDHTGTVTSYNPDKGYGFISRRGGGDVFVHVSGLAGRGQALQPGQRVRFEVVRGRRGQQARNVTAMS